MTTEDDHQKILEEQIKSMQGSLDYMSKKIHRQEEQLTILQKRLEEARSRNKWYTTVIAELRGLIRALYNANANGVKVTCTHRWVTHRVTGKALRCHYCGVVPTDDATEKIDAVAQ